MELIKGDVVMGTFHKTRNSYIDILKAIGIISIVIGHGSWVLIQSGLQIGPFVYTYHIMIFLFVSGVCFNYDDTFDARIFIVKKAKKLGFLFITYTTFFVLLHNIFFRMHLISSNEKIYHLENILKNILNSLVMKNKEILLGAFWFIPMYLIANVLFSILFSLAENMKCSLYMHLIFIVLTAIVGVYLNRNNIGLEYHMQTSVLGIPVMYLGYYLKLCWKKIGRYCYPWLFVPCACIIYSILLLNIGIIELSTNSIISPVLFYPVTLLGILFCLSLASLIDYFGCTRKIFAYIGRYSFHIMALHLLSFNYK